MAPCSGDDMWPPGKVQRVVSHLQEHPQTGLVYGDIEAIDEHGEVLSPSMVKTHGYGPYEGQIAGRLMDRNFVSAGAMAMRTALLPVLFPLHAYVAWEDWWFAWALTNVARVDFIEDVVFRYRQHGGNFIFGATEERGLDRLQAEIPFRRYMFGECPTRDGFTGRAVQLHPHDAQLSRHVPQGRASGRVRPGPQRCRASCRPPARRGGRGPCANRAADRVLRRRSRAGREPCSRAGHPGAAGTVGATQDPAARRTSTTSAASRSTPRPRTSSRIRSWSGVTWPNSTPATT